MRLIDADAFISEMNNRIEAAIKWGVNAIADRCDDIKLRAEQAVATFCEASLTAKKMPTIDAVPVKHGEWIEEDDAIITGTCSVCGWFAIFAETDVTGMPYCPNCGASMDGGKDDE